VAFGIARGEEDRIEMNIDIRMATQHDSPALRQFAEHALARKIGARTERVRRARIRLNDVNGPRGGVDKICQIRLEVTGGGDVSARGEASGWYEAVTIAVINARTALDRRIGRRRAQRARAQPEIEVVETIAEEAGRRVA
jgi:hypothetical protein